MFNHVQFQSCMHIGITVIPSCFTNSSCNIEDIEAAQLNEPHEGPTKFLTVKVLSSRESVTIAVDGSTVSICYC